MKNNKKAFTLIEILIAMFLFAMLAVLLIPNVTENAEKQLFVTQIKKVQNDIQQALLLMMSKNSGSLQSFCTGESPLANCFTDEVASNLEKRVSYSNTDITVSEDCDPSAVNAGSTACSQANAFSKKEPKFINKEDAALDTNDKTSFYAVNLKNGATISSYFVSTCDFSTDHATPTTISDKLTATFSDDARNAKVCGYMEVDVNAGKAPNTVGKDIHYFWIIDKDGLVPFGELDNFSCQGKSATDAQHSLGCTYEIFKKGSINYY